METRQGGVAHALDLIRARGGAAQLCVLRDGQVMVDQAVGCAPGSLFWIFSASKPFVALLIHLLAQCGQLSLDDPVASYWPGFGNHGKAMVTIRHVLRHRSGMSTAHGMLTDALAMTDWEQSIHNIERATLRWPLGEVLAYQPIIHGFILGEVIRLTTGVDIAEFLRSEFLNPLGLTDTYLGLPNNLWPRHVPIRATNASGVPTQWLVNRRAIRQAVIPAAGISTTARDLARFYQALLCDGELDGVQIIKPAAIHEARKLSSEGDIDKVTRLPVWWGQGFQLSASARDGNIPGPMGQLSSPATFGHNGSYCCIAWADPTRRLAFAHLTNLLPLPREGIRHHSQVADPILAACS
ncbi:MAG: beta-lactamase family protein [Pseudonocardia sp.]|nr:beta-lactamase family protein [Pseudonocardia sp.]